LTRPGQHRLAQQLAQLLQRSHLTHAHIMLAHLGQVMRMFCQKLFDRAEVRGRYFNSH
jgi:hypothetical protein